MPNPSHPSSAADLRARMAATGIGFAGIDGAWWLPAVEPFPLPAAALDELPRIGRALFALFDAIAELFDTSDELRALLTHRVPSHLPWLAGRESVLMLRPDFQLVAEGRDVRLVATELEICPAAQGFATAMQTGYRLATDLADGLAALLGNRPLLFTGSAQWSEFLFEQLAFCRALAERGVAAYVLYDRPIADIAAEVRAGQRWVPPMFGVRERTPDWNEDVLGRILAAATRRSSGVRGRRTGTRTYSAASARMAFMIISGPTSSGPDRLATRWSSASATSTALRRRPSAHLSIGRRRALRF